MKILCKFPTRSRPKQFLTTLRGWIEAAANPDDISFLVSVDMDDSTMTADVMSKASALHPEMIFAVGESKTKIEAVNADMVLVESDPWEIVLVISDDFFCRRHGWDKYISDKMTELYPDTDGSLWLHDGHQAHINTLPCLGRKYYERFGYIYEPSYRSFWVDNEQTDVGLALKRLAFLDYCIATHEHPAWGGGMKKDELYIRNNRYWAEDKLNYERRKSAGFPAYI